MLFGKKSEKVKRLGMKEAAAQLAQGGDICLIDARTPEEYREGHIPGSLNLPLGSEDGVAALAPHKDRRVFVYCQSGMRSAQSAAQLVKMGYTDVTNIGGIMSWTGSIQR